jgi:hypothetical protein
MLESERQGLQATLNALLSRKSDAPLAAPERLRPVPPPVKLEPDVLVDRLRGRNPQLFTEDARIRGAERNVELTYRNRYPDFIVGVSPIQMGTRVGEWEVMVEVNIPLQQESRRHQEHEAESMLSAAHCKEAAANRLIGELFENVAGLKAAQRIEMLTTTSLLHNPTLPCRPHWPATRPGRSTSRRCWCAAANPQVKQDRLKAQAEPRRVSRPSNAYWERPMKRGADCSWGPLP